MAEEKSRHELLSEIEDLRARLYQAERGILRPDLDQSGNQVGQVIGAGLDLTDEKLMQQTLTSVLESIDAHIATNITQRMQGEQWIAGLNQIKEKLLVPGDISRKMKLVTDGVVENFGADFCRIWIIGEGDRCDLGCFHAQVTEGAHICRNREKCLHIIASSGRYSHLDGKLHSRVPFGSYKPIFRTLQNE